MRAAFVALSLVHAAFAIALLAMPDAQLELTLRHQFNDWRPLLDLLRSPLPPDATVGSLRGQVMNLSWCAAPLPPGTSRAPYCGCINHAIDIFTNDTSWSSAVDNPGMRNQAVIGFVSCLSARPVWRVWPVWGVHYGTPAVYALLVSSCFLWVAAGLRRRWTNIPIWALCLAVSAALVAQAPLRNSFWVFTIVLIGALIEWVLLPGMADPPELATHGEALASVGSTPADRIASSFWWCEYLCAPVFAFYVPLMHCGRDFFMSGVVVVLGGAVGGLGLRSFWCAKAYAQEPKDQFRDVMQRITWLGILASSAALLSVAAVYYSAGHPQYSMGKGSIALLCLTLGIGLLQWPGIPVRFPRVLQAQAAVALARNVAMFALVAADLL